MILVAFLFISVIGCYDTEIIGGYTHPEFITNYTIDEHVERIKERTAEKFEQEITSGEIIGVHIEIVHAFYDNDPEYFLVELEFAQEIMNRYVYEDDKCFEVSTKYKHVIGFIENDNYYIGLQGYDRTLNNHDEKLYGFVNGESSYHYYGYMAGKKYYGALVQGVMVENQIMQLADIDCLKKGMIKSHYHSDKCSNGTIINETEYEKLMKGNIKLFVKSY